MLHTKIINKIGFFTSRNLFTHGGNCFECKGFISKVVISGDAQNCKIIIGKNASLNDVEFFIKGTNHLITIGDNVVIKEGVISVEGSDNLLKIDDSTTIEGALIAATESKSTISIGKDCMFSNKIEIRNGDSHSILKEGKRINQGGDVIIGNHVWVGCEAMILKNVTIGDNSIVAAKSLVSKSVASNVIVGGVPAKVINTEINWDRKLL